MAEPKKQFVEHVQGKVVEQINLYGEEDGTNEFEIRFQDKTGFTISLDTRLVIETAELRDWTKGEGTLIQKFL
jgi:hypothetical protein